MDVASKEYHYDVEYIFWKLRHSNAFHYVSCPTLQSGLQSFVNNSQEKAAQSYNRSGPESLLRDQGIICELTDSDAIDVSGFLNFYIMDWDQNTLCVKGHFLMV